MPIVKKFGPLLISDQCKHLSYLKELNPNAASKMLNLGLF